MKCNNCGGELHACEHCGFPLPIPEMEEAIEVRDARIAELEAHIKRLTVAVGKIAEFAHERANNFYWVRDTALGVLGCRSMDDLLVLSAAGEGE